MTDTPAYRLLDLSTIEPVERTRPPTTWPLVDLVELLAAVGVERKDTP